MADKSYCPSCLFKAKQLITLYNHAELRETACKTALSRSMHSRAAAPSAHDPSLEWPGSGDIDWEAQDQISSESPPVSTSQRQTCFRLVVKSSEVLARKRRVAILDAYEEAQIGRDASTSEVIPRIRLKDMEVSKLHATLFWDRQRKEWAIVDMGSKYGTFLKSSSGIALDTEEIQCGNGCGSQGLTSIAEPTFARLSPPRQASMPRSIRHSDEISIGRTAFVVHVHPAGIPCDDCHSEGESDIPLFAIPSRTPPPKIPAVAEKTLRTSQDAKGAINLLKKTLLTRHSSESNLSGGVSQHYIDRSAKRRALHPYSRSNSPPPGISSRRNAIATSSSAMHALAGDTSIITPMPASSSGVSYGSDRTPTSTISAPPTPISDANVGHRLLEKQGWVPGNTLGVPPPRSVNAVDTVNKEVHSPTNDKRMALSEPLRIAANIGRRGLGMRSLSSERKDGSIGNTSLTTAAVSDWRADSQRRRWDEVRRNVM